MRQTGDKTEPLRKPEINLLAGCFRFAWKDHQGEVVVQSARNEGCRALSALRLSREVSVMGRFRETAISPFRNWKDGNWTAEWDSNGFLPLVKHPELKHSSALRISQLFSDICDQVAALHAAGTFHNALFPAGVWVDETLEHFRFADLSLAACGDTSDKDRNEISIIVGDEDAERLAPEFQNTRIPELNSSADSFGLGRLFQKIAETSGSNLSNRVLELIHSMRDPDPGSRLEPALAGEMLRQIRADLQAGSIPSKRSIGPKNKTSSPGVKLRFAGREDALTALSRLVADVEPAGSVAITGIAGIGKTALIQTFLATISSRGTICVSARCEPARTHQPLSLWRWIARELAGAIAAGPVETRQEIAATAKARLSHDVNLLSAVIPEISSIIGKSRTTADKQASSDFALFERIFVTLIEIIAEAAGGLVLVVDDLHWADEPSLSLLRKLIQESRTMPVAVIVASRPGTQTPTISEAATRIELAPVTQQEVEEIVNSTFSNKIANPKRLANLLLTFSDGNPLHITQLLHSMIARNALSFDPIAGSWRWESVPLNGGNVSNDMQSLLSARIEQAPPLVKQLLRSATLLPEGFDIETLAWTIETPELQCQNALDTAIELGFVAAVASSEDKFRFIHDQLRNAVVEAVPKAEYAALRKKVGLRLLARVIEGASEDNDFVIVDLLRDAKFGDLDESQCGPLRRLALEIAMDARRRLDFNRAEQLHTQIGRLMGPAPWQDWSGEALSLTLERIRCAHAARRTQQVGQLFDEALARTGNAAIAADLHRLRCQLETQNEHYDLALRQAVTGLADLGLRLPQTRISAAASVAGDAIYLACRLRSDPLPGLAELPACSNEVEIAKMELIRAALPAAYFVAPELMLSGGLKLLRLSLVHGRAPATAVGEALYGLALGAFLGKRKLGFQIGEAALERARKAGDEEIINQVLLIHGHFIRFWAAPPDESRPLFEEGYQLARKAGDSLYANFHILGLIAHDSMLGKDLRDLKDLILWGDEIIQRSNDQFSLRTVRTWDAVVERLLEPNPSNDTPEILREPIREGQVKAVSECYRLIKLCQYSWLSGKADDAFEAGRKAERIVWRIPGQAVNVEHALYYGLALAGQINSGKGSIATRLLLRRVIRRVRRWAKDSPQTFVLIDRVLSAEILATRDPSRSMGMLENIGEEADGAGRLDIAAIASYLVAKRLDAMGVSAAREVYRTSASKFRRWGAESIAKRMDEAAGIGPNPNIAGAAAPEKVDARIAAARAIEEIRHASSSQNLVASFLVQAKRITHADIAAYVTIHDSLLNVDHVSLAGQGAEPVGIEPGGVEAVSAAVLRYVAATGQEVIGDLAADGRFRACPHLIHMRPSAVGCMPIIGKESPFGLIYLETLHDSSPMEPENLMILRATIASFSALLEADYSASEILAQRRRLSLSDRRAALLEAAKQQFAHFVPEKIRREVERDPEAPIRRSEPMQLSVLFIDIEGYTQLNERLPPDQILKMIETYFSSLLDPIYQWGGEICESTGDGLLVLFREDDRVSHAEAAVRSALSMQDMVRQLGTEDNTRLVINIGIDSGEALVGLERFERSDHSRWIYSARGQTVNTAARLVALAKHGQILVSEETKSRLAGALGTKELGSRLLKGMTRPTKIHAIV